MQTSVALPTTPGHIDATIDVPSRRHPTLYRLAQRQPTSGSELRSTVDLHPGPPMG